MNDDSGHLHRETWQRIPWLVNGTVPAAERAEVERHLACCADCRDELAFQQRIHDGLSADVGSEASARDAFAKLAERLRDDTDFVPPVRRDRRQVWVAALAAAVVVQAIGLVILTAVVVQQSRTLRDASYRTLGAARIESDAALIRLVPKPGLAVGALQTLLDTHGLRIVDGHAGRAIYGLAATRPLDVAATLASLRAHDGVLLAEPVLAEGVDAR